NENTPALRYLSRKPRICALRASPPARFCDSGLSLLDIPLTPLRRPWTDGRTRACRGRCVDAVEHRPLDPPAGGTGWDAARGRRHPPGRRPPLPRVAPEPAIFSRIPGRQHPRSRDRIRPYARTRRPPPPAPRLAPHRLAQQGLPRLRRLHGHSRLRPRPRTPDGARHRKAHRRHVRRSPLVALPPQPHLRRLQVPRLAGHPPHQPRPEPGAPLDPGRADRRRPARLLRPLRRPAGPLPAVGAPGTPLSEPSPLWPGGLGA